MILLIGVCMTEIRKEQNRYLSEGGMKQLEIQHITMHIRFMEADFLIMSIRV
jgi:hypothetical protein